jgi:hypothetical protein
VVRQMELLPAAQQSKGSGFLDMSLSRDRLQVSPGWPPPVPLPPKAKLDYFVLRDFVDDWCRRHAGPETDDEAICCRNAVLHYLYSHGWWSKGHELWGQANDSACGIPEIASASGFSRGLVAQSLRELENLGLISTHPGARGRVTVLNYRKLAA